MKLSYKVLLLLPYLIQFLLPFLLWPSSRNIVFIIQVPMFLLAYIGGTLFLTDSAMIDYDISEANVIYLIFILLLGMFFYVFTYLYSFKSQNKIGRKLINKANAILVQPFANKPVIFRLIIMLSMISIFFYIFSFIKMGFVPLFADDPISAKYFAGEYQETYRGVAHIFRMGINIGYIVAPFLIIYFFIERKLVWKLLDGIICLAIIILSVLTLRRGLIAAGIAELALLFVIYYKNGKYSKPIVCFYIIIFMVGSSLNSLGYYLTGLTDSFDIIAIISGVPDISDLLWFWNSFINSNYEFSYGRTIYGGLIPFHYEWNPAVLSKLVIGASTVAPSGGFRLPFQVQGYYTFGVVGTIVWSIYAGYVDAIQLKLSRYVILNAKDNYYCFYITMFFVNTMILLARSLLNMQIDFIFIIFINFIIIINIFYKIKLN